MKRAIQAYVIASMMFLIVAEAHGEKPMKTDLKPEAPIACTLSDGAFANRMSLIDVLKTSVVETKELEDGFAFQFPADDEWLHRLIDVVGLERECCQFLRFRITAEPNKGPLWLDVTGPAGVKEFLKTALGS